MRKEACFEGSYESAKTGEYFVYYLWVYITLVAYISCKRQPSFSAIMYVNRYWFYFVYIICLSGIVCG